MFCNHAPALLPHLETQYVFLHQSLFDCIYSTNTDDPMTMPFWPHQRWMTSVSPQIPSARHVHGHHESLQNQYSYSLVLFEFGYQTDTYLTPKPPQLLPFSWLSLVQTYR